MRHHVGQAARLAALLNREKARFGFLPSSEIIGLLYYYTMHVARWSRQRARLCLLMESLC